MKKRVFALILSALMALALIVVVPETDAGTPTLNVTNSTYNVEAGKSFTIKLNGIKASKVKWSSSKKSVATVSKKGVVKGIKKGNATITGKYKNLKFKVKVTVNKKGQATYNSDDLEVKFKEAKMATDEWGDEGWAITFAFTNRSQTPTSFNENFFVEAYLNDKEEYCNSSSKDNTKIKNGVTLDVTFYYLVKKGDKLDFLLKAYDSNYDLITIYESTKIFK